MEENKIVIFGGSFNPPLNSHFLLAEQMIDEYKDVEKIIFVPVNSKYHKRDLLPNQYRFEMLKMVCDKNSHFFVSDIELKQARPLYTIETLRMFQKEYPMYKICFMIGTDNLKELSTWKEAESLVNEYRIFVLERDQDHMEEIIKQDPFLEQYKNSFTKVEQPIRLNLSSSLVRDLVRRGKSIKYLLPNEVEQYIRENKLFLEKEQ
ncbi:MAG TPA: nicotinate (nicotinamide) nucleotide adenylyltransferase [Candidatus Merdicola faecigallinarum]|uniref:Probable nicotinate-nucleotide adenylyltransferase n=1 Tax=Candidatus Merdicola faecigallinarum TaxID=2840862 RepID=A0A9D1S8V3_9FIRM|nr:nicotinate (nicotinamide) nucleotide adenylyltransferase [Candidatus Merdicola faecigallinarum]